MALLLPFGAKRAPCIFHRLTPSVSRMMQRHACNGVVAYLHDFLIIIGNTREACELHFNLILALL